MSFDRPVEHVRAGRLVHGFAKGVLFALGGQAFANGLFTARQRFKVDTKRVSAPIAQFADN